MWSFLVTALIFVVIIGVVVLIHELGHFVAAKVSGIKVEEFAFGFGPKLFSKKYGETEYMLKLFPIGGYVKLLGEEEDVKSQRSYSEKGPWAQLLVSFSGVFMNFLLAVFLFYIILISKGFVYSDITYYKDLDFWFGDQKKEVISDLLVVNVIDDSAADNAGLEAPASILEINGDTVKSADQFTAVLQDNAGNEVEIKFNDLMDTEYTKKFKIGDDGRLGVELIEDVTTWKIEYNGWQRPFAGFLHAGNIIQLNFYAIGNLAKESVKEKTIEPVAQQVTGPIGLFAVVDIFKGLGLISMLDLIAMLNLTLAIFNIMPFPALDGGHGVIILIEAIRGKPINEKFKNVLFTVSMLLLFGLMIVISAKDFFQFGVWDWIKNLFSVIVSFIAGFFK
ncbi:site-2 protease family protein [Candidatus Dojkabacteria bacterium]|nr:site-2 protease family protein [Candidatus Dojkabacteria bacterium]